MLRKRFKFCSNVRNIILNTNSISFSQNSKFSSRLSIPEDATELAHPLPTRKPTVPPQPGISAPTPDLVVIARFRDRNTRDAVIRERQKLKGTPVTIVEDLTALNVEVMNRVKNSELVVKSWSPSWNGHIYAILKNKKKIKVRTFQAIMDCEVIDD